MKISKIVPIIVTASMISISPVLIYAENSQGDNKSPAKYEKKSYWQKVKEKKVSKLDEKKHKMQEKKDEKKNQLQAKKEKKQQEKADKKSQLISRLKKTDAKETQTTSTETANTTQ